MSADAAGQLAAPSPTKMERLGSRRKDALQRLIRAFIAISSQRIPYKRSTFRLPHGRSANHGLQL